MVAVSPHASGQYLFVKHNQAHVIFIHFGFTIILLTELLYSELIGRRED
jgi:hypothetical protein